MRRALLFIVLAASMLLGGAAPAGAAQGSMADPTGDIPDIVRFAFDNQQTQVVMTLKYADVDLVQSHSFYMKWRDGSYQLFHSPNIEMTELRLNGTKVRCKNLAVVVNQSKNIARATVPRGCLDEAPNRLKFQGIATMGVSSSDQTRVSDWIARG